MPQSKDIPTHGEDTWPKQEVQESHPSLEQVMLQPFGADYSKEIDLETLVLYAISTGCRNYEVALGVISRLVYFELLRTRQINDDVYFSLVPPAFIKKH